MSDTGKNECGDHSASSSNNNANQGNASSDGSSSSAPSVAAINNVSAPGMVLGVPPSPMAAQMPTQFVFQQQLMASPQQQMMTSPQQQQQQQQQQQMMASPQQQNGNGGQNAGTQQNQQQSPMTAMNAINMSAMNAMAMSGMGSMTMSGMNGMTAAGFQQQTLAHPGMSSTPMPQVQVIQQPYLQQYGYNAQGQPQFIMPGNIQLQSAGVNPTIQSAGFGQSIQVITAGKPFQPGQLTSHVVTTGKNLNMIQGQADNNSLIAQLINAQRNAGYTTIPTSNNQTLVIGPLISNSQGGISIPQQQQQGQQAKPNEMQKVTVQQQQQQQQQNQQQAQQQQIFQFVNGMQPKSPVMQGNNNMNKGAGVGSSAGPTMSMSMIPQQQQQQSHIITTQAPSGPMQIGGQMSGGQMIISPLQCSAAMGQPFGQLPPGLTWATHGGITQPTLLAGHNQIFIRGPQPEGMIFQAPQQQTMQAAIPNSQATVPNSAVKPATGTTGGTTAPLLQPKTTTRPLSTILPSSSGSSTTPTPIRPASSVSTQTQAGTSTPQPTTTRPTGKARKVGRPSTNQNQIRPMGSPALQTPLLQAVQQPQQQQQQQQMQQQQMQQQAQQQMQHQIVTQQFQIPQLNQIQVQQFQQQSQQQQPQQQQVMTMQFQPVQQTMDNMNQQVQMQQNINDQQQQQQQHFQQKPMPAMSPVPNGTTVSTSTGPATPTQQAQQLMSPVQHPAAMMSPSLNVQSTSVQQVVMQQPTLMLQPTVSMPYASVTTTTTTQAQVQRTGYKPIAPAPPQQPQQQQQSSQSTAQAPAQQQQAQTLVAMAPQSVQTAAGDKTSENQQILAIPVGSAGLVYPVRPQLNQLGPAVSAGSIMSPGIPFSPTMGLGMTSIHGTVINGSVVSSNSTPSGMTTAPLSAMANMTQTVQTTASIPHQQPMTVAVPSPSPRASQDSEVKKNGEGNGPPALIPVSEAERRDTAHTNGVHHEGLSPVLRDRSKDPSPPQAVVRPQILTHVLGDFVIQESSEPFPVGRFHSPTNETTTQQAQKTANGTKGSEDGEPPKKKLHMEQPSIVPGIPSSAGKPTLPQPGVCEGCGKTLEGSKFRRAKRFCSTACAKRTPASNTQSVANDTPATNGLSPVKTSNSVSSGMTNGLAGTTPATQTSPAFTINNEKEDCSTLDAELLALAAQQMRSPVPAAPLGETSAQQSAKAAEKSNPAKWTVAEVVDFVKNLQGCSDYAEDFALQEIDGQALMLLKADHLMTAMSMKLGPALKICAKIDSMRGVQGGNNPVEAQNGTTGTSSGNS